MAQVHPGPHWDLHPLTLRAGRYNIVVNVLSKQSQAQNAAEQSLELSAKLVVAGIHVKLSGWWWWFNANLNLMAFFRTCSDAVSGLI